MTPMKNLGDLLKDTMAASSEGALSYLDREMSAAIHEQDPMTPKILQNLTLLQLLGKIDLKAMTLSILFTAAILFAFYLIIPLSTPAFRRKTAAQVLLDSLDDSRPSGPMARSDDAVGPVLRSLSQATARYGSRREKSRLL